jgi:hypothetical protein
VGLLSSSVHKVSQKRNLVNNRLYQRQTVRCQSNDPRASSISDILAPAAKSSAGGAACSRLPWPAVLPRRPHHPLLLPSLARPSLYSPTSLHCCGFAASGSLPSWVSPSSIALVFSARRGQHCQQTTTSEE